MSAPRPPRCALGGMAAENMDADAIKRAGWREQKILVVSADDRRLDFVQREFVKQIGEMLYGSHRHR